MVTARGQTYTNDLSNAMLRRAHPCMLRHRCVSLGNRCVPLNNVSHPVSYAVDLAAVSTRSRVRMVKRAHHPQLVYHPPASLPPPVILPPSHDGAIAGGAAGGIVFLAFITYIVFYYKRWQRSQQEQRAWEEKERQRLTQEERERQRLAQEERERQRLAREEKERHRLARERSAWEEQERQRLAREEERQRLAREKEERQERQRWEDEQRRQRDRERQRRMDEDMHRAWEAYERNWAEIRASANTLTFRTIPWPLVTQPTNVNGIVPADIAAFLLAPVHSCGQSPKVRIRKALLRWHPDRLRPVIEERIVEDDRQEVCKCLGHVSE
jgi:hypothetical protein